MNSMSRQLVNVRVDGETVYLKAEDNETEISYKLRLNDYLPLGLSIGQQIDEKTATELDRLHSLRYGYNKCLRKLACSDHTVREIRDTLKEIKNLEEEDRETIISGLQELGYLNDEITAGNQLYRDQQKLLGSAHTKRNLLKRGVPADIVREVLSAVDRAEETERGIKRAEALARRLAKGSDRELKADLYSHLKSDGYENPDEIIARLDYHIDEETEKENCRRQLRKALARYAGRLEGARLTGRLYQYLYSHGYSSEVIREVMEQEVEYEDQ